MKRLQAYRFELRPTRKQCRDLASYAGCRRYVYNKALSLQREQIASGSKLFSYPELCVLLTSWKYADETKFLQAPPSQAMQQALKDLSRGYQNNFQGRAQPPRFHKKGKKERFRYPDGKQIKLDQSGARMFLPKLGWVRYRKSRIVEGRIKNATVIQDGDKWYVCIQTERDVEVRKRSADSVIGIDLGIAGFATTSDGVVIQAPNSFRKYAKKLAKMQRLQARKVKKSSNWQKQGKKIKKLHRKIRNTRNDFLHKASTAICKNHAVIVIEDLKVKEMSASAKGTLASPGRDVKRKSGLNKSILDQGWYEFRRQLEYKSEWGGGNVIAIPPMNTSLMCFSCKYVDGRNRVSQSIFRCISCEHEENADVNAARNILAAGRAVLACGENSLGFSVKQEPTVSTALAAV